MNFGHGIAIVMTAFVVFILTLVFSFISKNVDLEYSDYYSRELVFNETKEATERGQLYQDDFDLEQREGFLNISFDDSFPFFEKATLHFYRADNAKLDVHETLPQSRFHQLPLDKFKKGKYELRMEWTVDAVDYSIRKTFYISK